MNRYLWVLCVSIFSVGVYAIDVDTGGSIRIRYENKQHYDFMNSDQDYYLSQIRLNTKFTFNENSQLFVELQDARIHGDDKIENKNFQPFHDELDVHQLYVTQKIGAVTVKAGRQKINLGDQRLSSSLEWVNTARVQDAVRVTLADVSGWTVDAFVSELVGVDPNGFNDQGVSNGADTSNRYFDSGFHGVFMSNKNFMSSAGYLEAWWFLRENADYNDEIHTLGARFMTPMAGWNWDIQGAIQAGDWGITAAGTTTLDHDAAMFHIGADKDMLSGNVGFAYNWASGDSNSADGDHETFDNLYPLNHAYYGYMDLFALQNINNIEAVYKKSILNNKAKLRVAYQRFWLDDTSDNWYNASLGSDGNAAVKADDHVGDEIDITVKIPCKEHGVVIVAGYSHFITGKYIADTKADDNNADFVFVMVKKTF